MDIAALSIQLKSLACGMVRVLYYHSLVFLYVLNNNNNHNNNTDHDYGVNDGDWTHKDRDVSQQILLQFLDEPADSPRWKQAGVYATYTWGPVGQRVRVILLDIR
jgi:hypothetical protein